MGNIWSQEINLVKFTKYCTYKINKKVVDCESHSYLEVTCQISHGDWRGTT